MNVYLEPAGFLGTGASLLADLTLLAYVLLLVPAMLVGYVFARRKRFRPNHKWTMITITAVNWALILFLMVAAYRFDVAPNLGREPGNARYLLPALHALLGLPAQLLATYIVFRMLREDSQVGAARRRGDADVQRYFFRGAKPLMRLTLVLWLATASLGIISYLIRYDVLDVSAAGAPAPVTTPEAAAPEAVEPTEPTEAADPVVTPETAPAETPDADAPATTPET